MLNSCFDHRLHFFTLPSQEKRPDFPISKIHRLSYSSPLTFRHCPFWALGDLQQPSLAGQGKFQTCPASVGKALPHRALQLSPSCRNQPTRPSPLPTFDFAATCVVFL